MTHTRQSCDGLGTYSRLKSPMTHAGNKCNRLGTPVARMCSHHLRARWTCQVDDLYLKFLVVGGDDNDVVAAYITAEDAVILEPVEAVEDVAEDVTGAGG